MIKSSENQREERMRPFCQATGYFDLADVYVVLKETKELDYYEASRESNYEKVEKSFNDRAEEFDGFKMFFICAAGTTASSSI